MFAFYKILKKIILLTIDSLKTIWQYCWENPYLRFLNVGFLNIIFIFFSGIIINYFLNGKIPNLLIAILVSMFHISFSFGMRKIFIYKTKGNWIKEYLNCYMYYWASIFFYIMVLWMLIESYKMRFWLAQIISFLFANLFYSLTSRYFAFIKNSKQKTEKLEDDLSDNRYNLSSEEMKKFKDLL